MKTYPTSSSIEIAVPILLEDGEPYVDECSFKFELKDTHGKTLLSGEESNVYLNAIVKIAPEYNVVPVGQIKDARSLFLTFIDTNGEIFSETKVFYFIDSKEPLTVGLNSFVTVDRGRLLASCRSNLDYISNANDEQMALALNEACNKIRKYKFRVPIYDRAENIGYVSTIASRPRSYSDMMLSATTITLQNMTPEFYETLPENFKTALEQAQVIEANSILTPTDQIEERRQKGVILETINEVKMMFSNTAPIKSSVSNEAMKILSPWIVRTISIARV